MALCPANQQPVIITEHQGFHALHRRHNGLDSVSNHQLRDCLLNIYSGADQRKH